MTSYKIYYSGRPQLGDPYELMRAVFSATPMGDPYAPCSDGVSVTVTFSTAQTPADLGPLVKVELISNP
jgi:hypothetical protein